MANEIKIKITSDYDGSGMRALKRDLDEKVRSSGPAGEKIGASLGDGISKGAGERLRDSRGRFTKGIEDAVTKDGPGWGRKLGDKIADGIADAPKLGVAGGVIGAIMAPTLGAAMAGAVVGAAGGAGIIGGIVLAAKDDRVRKLGSDLGDTIMKDLNERAKTFVSPLMTSIISLKDGYKSIAPEIGQAFNYLSRQVVPLTDQFVNAGKSLVHGWSDAAQASGPVLTALGTLAERVGFRVGEMFSTFAEDAPAGASAIDDLSGALDHLIETATLVVHGLATIKGGLDSVDDAIDKARYWLEDHSRSLDYTADGYKKGSEAAELYRQGIIGAAGSFNDYDHYIGKATSSTEGLAKEHIKAADAADRQCQSLAELASELRAQADPAFAMIKAQQKMKKATEDVTQAIKDHGQKSPEYRSALLKQAEAALDLTGKAGALSSTFNGKLSPSMRNALRAAGMTEAGIRDLEKQFTGAKREGDRLSRLNIKIGTGAAVAAVRTLKYELAHMKTNWNVTIRQHFLTFGKPYSAAGIRSGSIGGLAHGGIKGAASGMVAGDLTWVGERGPELVSLPTGSTVHSSGDSSRMLRQMYGQAGQARGSGPLELRVTGTSSQVEQSLTATLLNVLRMAIVQQGGNVQTVLGRSY